MRNWKSYESKVEGISGESLLTLCDPQTSGGLLIAVAPDREAELSTLLNDHHLPIARIGMMTAKADKSVYLK
jgi:selenide,water dikinase